MATDLATATSTVAYASQAFWRPKPAVYHCWTRSVLHP